MTVAHEKRPAGFDVDWGSLTLEFRSFKPGEVPEFRSTIFLDDEPEPPDMSLEQANEIEHLHAERTRLLEQVELLEQEIRNLRGELAELKDAYDRRRRA